jgi:hypothetical protein
MVSLLTNKVIQKLEKQVELPDSAQYSKPEESLLERKEVTDSSFLTQINQAEPVN